MVFTWRGRAVAGRGGDLGFIPQLRQIECQVGAEVNAGGFYPSNTLMAAKDAESARMCAKISGHRLRVCQ